MNRSMKLPLAALVPALVWLAPACGVPDEAAAPSPGRASAAYAVLSDEPWTLLAASPDRRQLRYRVDPAARARLGPGVVVVHGGASGQAALRLVEAAAWAPDDAAVVALTTTAISAYKVFHHVDVDLAETVTIAATGDRLTLGDSGITLANLDLAHAPTVRATISTDNASTYALDGAVTRFAQEVTATLAAGASAPDPVDVPLDLPVVTVPFRRDLEVTFADRTETVPFTGTIEVTLAGRHHVTSAGTGELVARTACALTTFQRQLAWTDTWTADHDLDGECTVDQATSTATAAARVEAGLHLTYRVKLYDFIVPTFEEDLLAVLDASGPGQPLVRGWARSTFHTERGDLAHPDAAPLVTRAVPILDQQIKPAVRHGFVALPVSDAAPDGWGAPYADGAGTPINPPLGTTGGASPFNLIWRRPGATEWSVRRSFAPTADQAPARAHRAVYGNLDWVYKVDDRLAGHVTWKGPHGRNVPEQPFRAASWLRGVELADYTPVTIGSGTYHVYRGTQVYLDGQLLHDFAAHGFVSGAAIRHHDGRRYLLAATSHFSEDVDRLWAVELDVPSPRVISAGTVTLPAAYTLDREHRANSYFCNQSATRCSSVLRATYTFSHTRAYPTTVVDVNGTHLIPNDYGTSTSSTPVSLLVTVEWTSPMTATATVSPAVLADVAGSGGHRYWRAEPVPPADQRVMHYESHTETSHDLGGVPLAVDYVGDREVQLTGASTLQQARTHTDSAFDPAGDPVQETDHEVATVSYAGGGIALSAERRYDHAHVYRLDYPAKASYGSLTTSSREVELDLLHVDLRYGEVLYVETTVEHQASGSSTAPGIGVSIPMSGTSSRATRLMHNGTVLAQHALTTAASWTHVATEANVNAELLAARYYDTGTLAEDGHVVGSGVVTGMTAPEFWGFSLGGTTYRSVPEYAVASTGEAFFSVAVPTFGDQGMVEPIVHVNALTGVADPAARCELQGANPRFRYLGLH